MNYKTGERGRRRIVPPVAKDGRKAWDAEVSKGRQCCEDDISSPIGPKVRLIPRAAADATLHLSGAQAVSYGCASSTVSCSLSPHLVVRLDKIFYSLESLTSQCRLTYVGQTVPEEPLASLACGGRFRASSLLESVPRKILILILYST
jgi:hypothetical protein